MAIEYPPVKSKTHVAIISGKVCELYHNHQMVKWHNRWRLIQNDETGANYVVDSTSTVFFEIVKKEDVETYLNKMIGRQTSKRN